MNVTLKSGNRVHLRATTALGLEPEAELPGVPMWNMDVAHASFLAGDPSPDGKVVTLLGRAPGTGVIKLQCGNTNVDVNVTITAPDPAPSLL